MRRRSRLVVPAVLLALGVLALIVLLDPAVARHGSDDNASPTIEHVVNVPTPRAFRALGSFNSDLAFWGNLLFAGNYSGFRIVDIADPMNPVELVVFRCRGPQNDVAVYGWQGRLFLFTAIDRPQTKETCDSVDAVLPPPPAPVDPTFFEGVRIFDVTDPRQPQFLKAVHVQCGAHTITLVPAYDPNDPRLFIYVPSSVSNRGPDCPGQTDRASHRQITIIDVPLDAPQNAVARPYPINPDTLRTPLVPGTPIQGCHDFQAFLPLKIVAASCNGEGQLWDISDPGNPCTLDPACHTRVLNDKLVFWHSAEFTWDGQYVVFNDEHGGGGAHGCDGPSDTRGNAWMYRVVKPGQPIGPVEGRFMLPRPQPPDESCTVHNGNFITVAPDRGYFLVLASYQGGTNVINWTTPAAPVELGFYEPTRDPPQRTDVWSSYWYNDFIYANDGLVGASATRTDSRGIDVFRLVDERGTQFTGRRLAHMNPQTQE
jgi:hypothetical protein